MNLPDGWMPEKTRLPPLGYLDLGRRFVHAGRHYHVCTPSLLMITASPSSSLLLDADSRPDCGVGIGGMTGQRPWPSAVRRFVADFRRFVQEPGEAILPASRGNQMRRWGKVRIDSTIGVGGRARMTPRGHPASTDGLVAARFSAPVRVSTCVVHGEPAQRFLSPSGTEGRTPLHP